jgi:hypothetical protein
MLEQFTQIPIPMPPMLPEALGYEGDARYFSLHYAASEAWFSDGQRGYDTSWRVYSVLVDHFAIQIYLWDYNLGSDDDYEQHRLVCDRLEQKMYVGDSSAVVRFLQQQHLPVPKLELTQEQLQQFHHEIAKMLAKQPPIPTEYIEAQMARETELLQQMQVWLDHYINEALVKQYLKCGKAQAYWAIRKLKARLGIS